MKWYRADMHIHSVLSPCGDIDMSPTKIIEIAKEKNLDIIGITDHNTTRHARLMVELGKTKGITVIPGVEITTQEEVHCLAFFENAEITEKFEIFLNNHLPAIKNKAKLFGEQLIVNDKEEILEEVEYLLISRLDSGIDEIEKEVHKLNGIFIPAHINKQANGIYSQIGLLPPDLNIDALEYLKGTNLEQLIAKRPELKTFSLIQNSDAHYTNDIGDSITEYYLNSPSFKEWSLALKKVGGRKIKLG
jgi:PHP family Zn ribbon phosphoesterase